LNNKRLGTEFEREFCELMAAKGWWVHFITPAANGGQPFDVIAVKSGTALAIDCKTSVKRLFSINRLEENQKLAFEKWIRCGNNDPMIAVKYKEHVYLLPYERLKNEEVIDLEKEIFI
jgi:Holliday junction resolvase